MTKNNTSVTSNNSYSQALFELATESNIILDIEIHASAILKLINDSSDFNDLIKNPTITLENISTTTKKDLEIDTNFDQKKINSLFSNISTLNLLELFDLKKDFEKLGYSSDEIIIHLMKLFSTPLLYSVLTILSAIIMFNMKRDKSLFFHVILGILMSVIIYYINFMFSSLGNNGKIPIIASIFLPILFISIFAIIGLIRINEK